MSEFTDKLGDASLIALCIAWIVLITLMIITACDVGGDAWRIPFYTLSGSLLVGLGFSVLTCQG